MTNQMASSGYIYDRDGTYQIVVAGKIGPSWSDRLDSMTVVATSESAGDTSTLVGDLHDQAALMGVIQTLYDLRLTLLSLRRLGAFDQDLSRSTPGYHRAPKHHHFA
jgi:hypothetical protein